MCLMYSTFVVLYFHFAHFVRPEITPIFSMLYITPSIVSSLIRRAHNHTHAHPTPHTHEQQNGHSELLQTEQYSHNCPNSP